MARKSRSELKGIFRKGAYPTEEDFADLIDSPIFAGDIIDNLSGVSDNITNNSSVAGANVTEALNELDGRLSGYPTRDALAAAQVPAPIQYVRTAGYSAPGDGGGALYVRVENEPEHGGKVQDAGGQWWELAESNPIPQMFGSMDAAAINSATLYSAATVRSAVHLSGGDWPVDETVVLRDGVPLLLAPDARLVRDLGFVGTMVQSEDFETYTGTNDATAPYPRRITLKGGRIDGRYMTDDFNAYENQDGGNGIEIYAHILDLDTTVENIPGVGVWIESSTGNGNLDLGYPRKGIVRLEIQCTKYEGLIWKGLADQSLERVFCTRAGALTNAEQDAGDKVVSPTYGSTNGGFCDGIVFDTGAEVGLLHSWGHTSGRGVAINGGRVNAWLLMAETCRYGACRITGNSYGVIENLELHRAGGYDGDTQPLLWFDSPGSGGIGWMIKGKIYQKATWQTTARNLVEIGDNARQLKADFDLTGDNVPGHGIVIEGAATHLDIHFKANRINGTAPDGLAASALYRKATFSSRSYRISGYVQNADCVFRSSGEPRVETIDITFDIGEGQTPFAGDRPANSGQDWDIRGTVGDVFKGSKAMGASPAFSSNTTSEQTISIPHNLIASPRFGRASLLSIYDTPSSISAAVLQYAYVASTDDTHITAKVKFSTSNGTDTQPRFNWQAEV